MFLVFVCLLFFLIFSTLTVIIIYFTFGKFYFDKPGTLTKFRERYILTKFRRISLSENIRVFFALKEPQ